MRSTEPSVGRQAAAGALLIEGLNVYYGRAHALQNVSLSLPRGVLD